MAYEIFFDGFETYANAMEMLSYGYSGKPYAVVTGGRRGGKAMQPDAVGNSMVRPITPSSHVVVGAAVKAYSGVAIHLRNGTTVHAVLTLPALAVPTLAIGGAAATSMSTVYPYDTYMFVEVGIYVHNSLGTAEVRVNGSNVGWFPQVVGDTQNGATTTIDNVRVSATVGGTVNLVDDFYVTYGDELVWLGDSRVDRLALTGNATPQDWTPSSGNAWERLNAGDGYIESATDEASSLFEVGNLTYSPLAIHAVKVGGLIKKSDAGYREACLLVQSGTTLVEGDPLALSTDTLGLTEILKVDPATGVAWDYPGVNALQAGVRVKV